MGQIPLDITLHHHERRDGSGYPDKQAGDQISELAQMAAIVDVYDASYRRSLLPQGHVGGRRLAQDL